MKLRLLAAIGMLLVLAGCDKKDNTYQGWIEANLIFVAPDEVGRVETLSVKEGDSIKKGDPLFTVDDDLQQADLAQVKASLINARQTFDRAATARQNRRRHAKGSRRRDCSFARRTGASQFFANAPGAPQRLQSGDRHGPASLLPSR